MISYLVLSTLSMGILLLFYHALLEQEKILHFNRGFIVFALVFSLIVPFLPVGIFSSVTAWPDAESFTTIDALTTELPADYQQQKQTESPASSNSAFALSDLLLWSSLLIYFSVTIVLFIRFLRIVHMIQLKAKRHRMTSFMGVAVVLHDEQTVPYTFLRTIYVNRDQYNKGTITLEVLRHELAHVRQLHSLDILFLELLKIVMWFNPVLYLYKKAMILNHEFLADQAVLSAGASLTSYQKLLFDALKLRTPHGLSSNFSFSITKKRFTMMSRSHSQLLSTVKMTLSVPLFLILALLMGCESTSSNISDIPTAQEMITLEITENDVIRLNGKEFQYEELDEYFSDLPEPPEVVYLKVSPEAPFGLITDVQQILRKNDALRINYKTSRPASDTPSSVDPDQLTDDYLDSVGVYLQLPPTDQNKLEGAYTNLVQTYDSLKISLQQIPDAPPPPPLPPSPDKRLDWQLNEPNILPPPPPPIETKKS